MTTARTTNGWSDSAESNICHWPHGISLCTWNPSTKIQSGPTLMSASHASLSTRAYWEWLQSPVSWDSPDSLRHRVTSECHRVRRQRHHRTYADNIGLLSPMPSSVSVRRSFHKILSWVMDRDYLRPSCRFSVIQNHNSYSNIWHRPDNVTQKNLL